jgi:molecular chaperone GrpE (heat shock protein)
LKPTTADGKSNVDGLFGPETLRAFNDFKTKTGKDPAPQIQANPQTVDTPAGEAEKVDDQDAELTNTAGVVGPGGERLQKVTGPGGEKQFKAIKIKKVPAEVGPIDPRAAQGPEQAPTIQQKLKDKANKHADSIRDQIIKRIEDEIDNVKKLTKKEQEYVSTIIDEVWKRFYNYKLKHKDLVGKSDKFVEAYVARYVVPFFLDPRNPSDAFALTSVNTGIKQLKKQVDARKKRENTAAAAQQTADNLVKQDQEKMANRAIANTYESKAYAYLEKIINEELDKILG